MVGRRKYDDGCAVAHGLDLIGERWALLVVRDLLLGPKRFTDLRAGMPSASADMLSQRLRELQDAGVVRRRRLPPPAASWVYELTDWGAELEPIVTALGQWASRSASLRPDAPIGADSLMLSLRALFDPQAAAGFAATVAVRLGDDEFRVQVADGQLQVMRGQQGVPDVAFDADTSTLSALLRGDLRLAEARRSGELKLAGDIATAKRFLALFPMPQAAPAGAATAG